jgi:hypothetical protein
MVRRYRSGKGLAKKKTGEREIEQIRRGVDLWLEEKEK